LTEHRHLPEFALYDLSGAILWKDSVIAKIAGVKPDGRGTQAQSTSPRRCGGSLDLYRPLCASAGEVGQPPPEKCAAKACAKPPNPPRVTLPEAESDALADACRADESSLPKKLLRDDREPPLPDEDPCGGHCAFASNASPARGPQFSFGIIA
jgi:hypothetical protein